MVAIRERENLSQNPTAKHTDNAVPKFAVLLSTCIPNDAVKTLSLEGVVCVHVK